VSSVAVTGASGFVGSHLASRFERDGWRVVRTTFRLGDDVPTDAFANVDALVHGAYDFRPVAWADIHRVNVEGTRRLLQAAVAAGVQKIVVLSTISAFPGCRSRYGRAKLEIEAEARRAGAAVLRPGLVFVDQGSDARGMFGSLLQSSRASIVPLIGDGSYCQYLVHVDDLYALVARLASGAIPTPTSPVVVASSRCWPMRELITALASRQGRKPRFVSVPWQAVWLGLRAAEVARLPLGYRSDSVVSLVNQDPSPDFSGLKELGFTAREFRAV
jgi:nucleoside-diphosphate-sugar epimerase